MASIELVCARATEDIAGGDLRESVDKLNSCLWWNSSLTGDEREFCLAGDKEDNGSGMLLASEAEAKGGNVVAERRKDVKSRHEVLRVYE